MSYPIRKYSWLAVTVLAAGVATAQDAGTNLPPALKLETAPEPLKNRFGLSYRPGFNISARFKGIGAFPARTNPGPPTGRGDRFYDDGYVRPDSGASAGLSWFWGYQNDSQVPGNDTIQFHSSSSTGTGGSGDVSDGPQQGLELSYDRDFGKVGKRARWGLEAAFDYTAVNIDDSRPATSSVNRLTDTYALNGVVPPQPTYSGTFLGPGPLIGDSPTRTFATIASGASVTGKRELSADLFGVRLGPYLEIPLDQARRFNVSLSGGLALAVVSSDFSFRESTTIPGAGTVNSSGSGTDSELLVGGYLGANFSYRFDKSWSVFAGAAYQYLPTYSQKLHGREVELDLTKSVFVNVGLGFAF